MSRWHPPELVTLDAAEQRLLAARVERLGWAPVYRAAKVSDHVMRSAVKGKGISKQAAELIRTYVATLISTSPCAWHDYVNATAGWSK